MDLKHLKSAVVLIVGISTSADSLGAEYIPVITSPPKTESGNKANSPPVSDTLLERSRAWLASRGEEANGLVAMGDLSGEEADLLRAAEKFPGNARVCESMVDHWLRKEEYDQAGKWVDRLIACDPGNPIGYGWKADLMAREDKPERMVEALQKAAGTTGKPVTYWSERMLLARDALRAGGATARQSADSAFRFSLSRVTNRALSGKVIGVLRRLIEDAKKKGDPAEAEKIARLGAAVAERLRPINAPTMIERMLCNGMLRTMLGSLPPEAAYGSDGGTVGAELAKVERERGELNKLSLRLNSSYESLLKVTDEQANEYIDRLAGDGEIEASTWLAELAAQPSKELR